MRLRRGSHSESNRILRLFLGKDGRRNTLSAMVALTKGRQMTAVHILATQQAA
jgi:hypothetical protein